MKIISVIPARAGSKGIKNKNIIKLNNKHLIEYTFSAALKSNIKNNFVITDCKKTKKISKKYKINSEYLRPKNLSGDKISFIETFLHFNNWLKLKNISFDYIVVLQPTSPLRNYKDINKCLKIIKNKKPLSLFSISPSVENPFEAINLKNKKKWNYVIKRKKIIARRQDFKINSFFENGAIYIAHANLLKKRKLYSNIRHLNYIMPKIRSFDINDKEDLKVCSAILKSKRLN
jgi:CMP-N,N'-diacetyllegionaminic acid synthase